MVRGMWQQSIEVTWYFSTTLELQELRTLFPPSGSRDWRITYCRWCYSTHLLLDLDLVSFNAQALFSVSEVIEFLLGWVKINQIFR